ncbi:MAG: alpha/beta hydrolase [Pseudomonadota bacterium]
MSELKDTRGIYPDKYHTLLDDELWDFINRTAHFYADDAVEWSIEQQRAKYDELCAAFSEARPNFIKSGDTSINCEGRSVGLRHYQDTRSTGHAAHILFIHGGGFVVGGLESHDSICVDLVAATGLPLTAVDYALAPEHIHPADTDDCLAAFQHLAQQTDLPIILVGDSAGGNLCAAIAHANRGKARQPLGQVLIYPGLGSDVEHGSFVDHAHSPGITQADTRFYKAMRTGRNGALLQSAKCCPLIDPNFSNLPPTRIHTADCDPLKDDGLHYALKMAGAGGDVKVHNWAGLIHGHLRARYMSVKAKACFEAIVADVKELAAPSRLVG